MKAIENHCVDCGLPCLGNSCPYRNVIVYYCDDCHDDAEYRIDDIDFCEKCAESYIDDVWNELTVREKAKLLDIDLHRI